MKNASAIVTTPRKKTARLLRLPEFFEDELRLHNIQINCNAPLLLPAKNGILSIVSVMDKALRCTPYLAITSHVNGEEVQLVLDKRSAKGLLNPLVDPEHLSKLPASLRMAVFDAVFDSVLHHFEDRLGWTIELDSVATYQPMPGSRTWPFSLALNDVATGFGFLEMNPEFSKFLTGFIEQLLGNSLLSEEFWPEVETNISFTIDEMELSASEYSLLSEGDVLLSNLQDLENELPVIVNISPNLRAFASLLKHQLTVTSPPELIMQDTISDNADFHADELNELGIKLTFDVGTRTVTLAELKAIKPGYSMELDRFVDNPVRILANGRVFATGQLIQVGKRIGVQITEIKHGNRAS